MRPTPLIRLNRKAESTLSNARRIRKAIHSVLIFVPVTLLVSNQLAGCATAVESVASFAGVPSEPRRLSKQELSTYDTVEEMMAEEFGTKSAVYFGAIGYGKLLEPYENTKAYCELHGGKFIRTQPLSSPKLSFRPKSERDKGHHRNFERGTAGVFGIFQCIRSEGPLWEVSIGHNGNQVRDRDARTGLTTILVDVRSHAVLVERELREMERRAEAEAAAVRAQERQAELAEARRQRREEVHRLAEKFRSEVGLGGESHCGMVVQIRESLYEVQTQNGPMWFRRDQLFPAGTVPCRIFNGEYMEPEF